MRKVLDRAMRQGEKGQGRRVASGTRVLFGWALGAAMGLFGAVANGCMATSADSATAYQAAMAEQVAPAQPQPAPPIAPSAASPAAKLGAGFGDVSASGMRSGNVKAKGLAPSEQPPETESLRGRLLIYNAVLVLAVYQAQSRLSEAEKIAVDAGGYLVRRHKLSMTVRVPAVRFQEVLRAMERLGDVLDRRIEANDVTEEFFDVETRLRSARAVRDRYQELLERANTVEEALRVEEQLSRVVLYIEQLEGRLKRLKELLAYSTLEVQFDERRTDVVSSRVKLPFPWLGELGLGRLLDLGGAK